MINEIPEISQFVECKYIDIYFEATCMAFLARIPGTTPVAAYYQVT